jgi:hypothetical protein
MDERTRLKYLTINFIAAVLLGSVYGILQKCLYLTKGEHGNFDHPYFVSFLISFSMMNTYPIYLLKERISRKAEERKKLIEQINEELSS